MIYSSYGYCGDEIPLQDGTVNKKKKRGTVNKKKKRGRLCVAACCVVFLRLQTSAMLLILLKFEKIIEIQRNLGSVRVVAAVVVSLCIRKNCRCWQ
jgi:hypothetical protein